VRSGIVGQASLHQDKSKTSIYYDIKEKYLGDLPNEKHRIISDKDEKKMSELRKQLPMPPDFYSQITEKEPSRFFANDTSYVGFHIKQDGASVTIISSAVDLYGLEEMSNLKGLLVTGFFIAMVFVFTFGRLFSTQIFAPIRRIIKNVKGISAHNLHNRLAIDDNKDEVTDLSTTFNDMLNRLEITFEIQNNFVSNASHEFKTPLTVISGEAQLGHSLPGLPPAAKESFQTIIRESEKLELLINSMLSLAQTGFDGKKEQWEAVRIDELLLAVKSAADQIIPGNHIEINFDELPDDDRKLVVNGNATLLKSAIANIVLNSCKYSDNQSVDLVIKADEAHVILHISDKGIGIPDREIGQIFVPFFRASNTTNYKGYGVGLPLANNIIKLHQGKIMVKSQVGFGTRFIIYLPFEK
jgi:signal transduction histidine kinase